MTTEGVDPGLQEATVSTPVERLREVLLSHFACAGCGYGASRATAPERCPMCGDSVWDEEPWRPFGSFLSDADGPAMNDG